MRKALTISLAVDNNTSKMESPLKLPERQRSSGCGNLEAQIHWTQITGRKVRYHKSQQRNGSTLFDHNLAAMDILGMGSRKPCVILTDVLQTEQGRAYLDRRGSSHIVLNGGQTPVGQRRTSLTPEASKQGPQRRRRTPKGAPKTLFLPVRRTRIKTEEKKEEEEEQKEREEDKEVPWRIGEVDTEPETEPETDQTCTEVTGDGLSRTLEPEDISGRDDSSPQNTNSCLTNQSTKEPHSEEKELPEPDCNGTSPQKSPRESVLRLSNDPRQEEGPPLKRLRLEVMEEKDGEAATQDPGGVVSVVVGGAPKAEPSPDLSLDPVFSEANGSQRNSGVQSGQEAKDKDTPSDTIVLSSDDEEGGEVPQRPSSVFRPAVGAKATDTPRRPLEKHNTAFQDDLSNIQVMRMFAPALELPPIPSPLMPSVPTMDDYYAPLPFTDLLCGGLQGQANGHITISDQVIVIPLTDTVGQVEVTLTLRCTELKRYSVWENQELFSQDLDLGYESKDKLPPSFLLLYVSHSQACIVQKELRKLSVREPLIDDQASPFLLISLQAHLEGVEGAVLRSILDIVCLNNLTLHDSPHGDVFNGLADSDSPQLSLNDSLELIRKTRLDPTLISLLGQPSTWPGTDEDLDEDEFELDEEEMEVHVQLEEEPQMQDLVNTEPVLKPEIELKLEPERKLEPQIHQRPELVPEIQIRSQPGQQITPRPQILPKPQVHPRLQAPTKPQTPTRPLVPTRPQISHSLQTPTRPQISHSLQTPTRPQIPHSLQIRPSLQVSTSPQVQPTPDKMQKEVPEKPTKEESTQPQAIYTLCHRRTKGSYSVSMSRPDASWTKYKHQGLPDRLILFPPPPSKGGITVTMEDLQRLDSGQFLNDVIIDFYLKYLLHNAPAAAVQRSHIFSSFFYKQLTRRDNASEDLLNTPNQRLRRHQRVKTWTRHVDIFEKDFLFVPVNQESHWYLVVICFPGLQEAQSMAWKGPASENGKGEGLGDKPQAEAEACGSKKSDDAPEVPTTSSSSDSQEKVADTSNAAQEDSSKDLPPGPTNCTELTCQRETVCKRPCILIMDSLKLSLHERVFKLLREYLQSEWEVRRGSTRDFGPDHMKGSHCKVPLQDNSSDCGLYLLQYVESFLKDPVVHFDLPLCLERWFPRPLVRRKRDEIRDLVLYLHRLQKPQTVSS